MTRIQRKRTRGWRPPEGTKYVGRGTQWGNPYTASSSNFPIESFRIWVDAFLASHGEDDLRKWLKPLMSARHLSCWCPLDQPCHADVLVELCTRLRAAASDNEENT